MVEHSPLPWKWANDCTLVDATDDVVFAIDLPEFMEDEDKDFIVRAVNVHTELIEALKSIREMARGISYSDAATDIVEAAATAIAKAEG